MGQALIILAAIVYILLFVWIYRNVQKHKQSKKADTYEYHDEGYMYHDR